ncbi:MAG: DUF6600 domain-containing protein [Planctomycetota bacterium]
MLYRVSCVLVGTLALCCGAFGASVGVDDVIKMQQSAVGDDVLIAFVESSAVVYDLSAEDIQQLEDAKVPATVIAAMLDHGKQLGSTPAASPVTSAAPPTAEPAALGASAVEPAPSTSEVVYAPAPDQANISLFYEALSPYGAWSQDGGNGWVWEPTDGVRDANWRPYANNGHWAWTDSGWYWESDSPYGWATFHYGRWGYNSRHRWSWAPDNVWGPAWVNWRQSEDCYGWAPLPFGSRFEVGVGFSLNGVNVGFDFDAGLGMSYYNFVPCGNFLDINLGLVLEPEGRRRDFYNRTKIVNNTYVYNNNRIINSGVPMTTVQRATNRQLVAIKVVDANIAAGQPIRGERRSANTIEVYRPKLANVAPVEPPVMVARQKAAALHASTAADRKAAPVDRQAAEQAASRRVAEQKALLKDKKPNPAVERKGTVETIKAPKVDASYVNKEAATERKAATEAEKQASEKVRQAKAEATTREKASEQRQSEAQLHSANTNAAAERSAANKEAATERKAATETSRESKQNAAEERQSANKEAATERSAENKEAATERKAATETSRESKQNAAEERQSTNKEAATERKAETSREPKQNAGEEKAHEKK